jgi:hypothetical protein
VIGVNCNRQKTGLVRGLPATSAAAPRHNGPLLDGNSFRKLRIFKPYANQNDLGSGAIAKGDDDFD